MSQPIFSSMISLSAMSATPIPGGISEIKGWPIAPPPELSWRTRRESRFTNILGLPTLANACLHNSLFKCSSSLVLTERGRLMSRRLMAIEKLAQAGAGVTLHRCPEINPIAACIHWTRLVHAAALVLPVWRVFTLLGGCALVKECFFMRALWKGAISFGLVNIPIGLYPATKPQQRISFD